MKIADVLMILFMAAYAGRGLQRRRWLDVGAGLFAVLAFALDLAGIAGPRL